MKKLNKLNHSCYVVVAVKKKKLKRFYFILENWGKGIRIIVECERGEVSKRTKIFTDLKDAEKEKDFFNSGRNKSAGLLKVFTEKEWKEKKWF